MRLPKMPSFRLDNKRALIVGSSSGIGIGCATALADAGASVVLAARRKNLLDDLKNSLEEKGHNAETIKLDISEVEDVKKQSIHKSALIFWLIALVLRVILQQLILMSRILIVL